jgi:hypothetical protein
VVQRPTQPVETLQGSLPLAEAVVREAVRLMRPDPLHDAELAFARALARDGYAVAFDESDRPTLRASLPQKLGLPAADDEVHQLLKQVFTGTLLVVSAMTAPSSGVATCTKRPPIQVDLHRKPVKDRSGNLSKDHLPNCCAPDSQAELSR